VGNRRPKRVLRQTNCAGRCTDLGTIQMSQPHGEWLGKRPRTVADGSRQRRPKFPRERGITLPGAALRRTVTQHAHPWPTTGQKVAALATRKRRHRSRLWRLTASKLPFTSAEKGSGDTPSAGDTSPRTASARSLSARIPPEHCYRRTSNEFWAQKSLAC
jgi:hypothetical protein